jgi:hypothetical protein
MIIPTITYECQNIFVFGDLVNNFLSVVEVVRQLYGLLIFYYQYSTTVMKYIIKNIVQPIMECFYISLPLINTLVAFLHYS